MAKANKELAKLVMMRDGIAGQVARLEESGTGHPVVVRGLKRALWGLNDQIAWIEAGNDSSKYVHKPELAREAVR